MSKAVQVFLNPRSGSAGRREAADLRRLFSDAALSCTVNTLRRNLDLASILQRSPDALAVAAGGDGTINAVANAAVQTGRTLGILPLGTLNHFASDLGIPFNPTEAVHLIATGTAQPIDVAEVNGRLFVNNSSLGAYPSMVMDRERLKRSGWNKWLSLVWASLRGFIRFHQLQVDLTLHGEARRCTTPFLFVGNNEYRMAGAQLGTRESLNRGRLFLYLAPGATRLAILRLTFAALFGRVREMPEFQEFCVEEFTVHRRGRRVRVSLDGEVRRMAGPLNYRIRPSALNVIQPTKEIGTL